MRVAFETLGCRLNQFETQAMATRLRRDPSIELVDWRDEADVYVVNSCAVTSRAEQKCRQLARAAKRRVPTAKVMVVGCYPQLAADALARRPEIDAILGTAEKHRLDEYLPLLQRGSVRSVGRLARDMPIAAEWIDDFGAQSRPTVKVQEGCNMRCSFCAIWKARGASRSREPREVVEQALGLAAHGYREIVLAGVHLGHYGRDLPSRCSLHDLLDMLLELVPESVRFRLSSIDPSEVDVRLAERLQRDPRLCRYLHLPLQSGSESVLLRMRRAYTALEFERLVDSIGRGDSHFGLGVDLICGFPGESEAEFAATVALLERLPISFYHVFRYSDRPGTAAAQMPSKVPVAVAQGRSEILRRLGERKRDEFLRRLIGHEFVAVVEGEQSSAELMLDNYASALAEVGSRPRGSRIRVRIQSLGVDGRLIAIPIPASEAVGT